MPAVHRVLSFLAGLSPWGLDITPIALSITCGLLYYGIFHCGVFDLAPLARTLIFNTIRDAVLILDNHDRLLDFNPAALTVFPVLDKKSIGIEIEVLFFGTPDLAGAPVSNREPYRIRTGQRD